MGGRGQWAGSEKWVPLSDRVPKKSSQKIDPASERASGRVDARCTKVLSDDTDDTSSPSETANDNEKNKSEVRGGSSPLDDLF